MKKNGFTFISRAGEGGFTLIELLVVISIIGILATLLIANIGGVRERARDARRKSDLNQIQKALELYKNSQKPPEYSEATDIEGLATDLQPDYIQEVPHDPKCSYNSTDDLWECTGWLDYSYTPDGTDSLKYTLWTCLENRSDQQQDTDQSGCPSACTSLDGVCLTKSEP